MKVSDVMTLGVASVPTESKLSEAARTMLAHRIRSLPVVDAAGKLVGILSETDMVRALAGDRSWISGAESGKADLPPIFQSARVADFMSSIVTTIDGNAPVEDAIRLMCDYSLHHLPVLDGETLRGMLSPADLLRAAMDLS